MTKKTKLRVTIGIAAWIVAAAYAQKLKYRTALLELFYKLAALQD